MPRQHAEHLPPWNLIVPVMAGVVTWLAYRIPPASVSDLQQFWIAARALAAGRDPYATVPTSWPWPLFYPLPAVLLVFPIGVLPLEGARVAWAMIAAGVFVRASQRTDRPLWVGMLSASFVQGIILGQWSPLLTAGAVLPWLSITWVAKPTVGLALFAGWPRREAIVGGSLLVAASLALDPHWPLDLWRVSGEAIHRAPVLRPGGALLLLALLRWRVPEARLLAGLACVPHSLAIFETLPLFLVPRRKQDAYALAVLTYVAVFLSGLVPAGQPGLTASLDRRWPFMLVLVYLPTLVMVLRPPHSVD